MTEPAEPFDDAGGANPFDVGLPMAPPPASRPRPRSAPPASSPPSERASEAGSEWSSWLVDPVKHTPRPSQPSHHQSTTVDEAATGRHDRGCFDVDANPSGSLVDRSGPSPGPAMRARARARADAGVSSSWWISAVIGIGVAIGIAAVVLVLVNQPSSSSRARTASASRAHPVPPDPQTAALATPGCVQQPDPTAPAPVSGTGAGDTRSAAGVVLAFEWAYYSARSGQAARSLATSEASVPDAGAIQRGIDRVPAGTRYCVQITPEQTQSGTVRVALTEQYPGGDPQTFTQRITTRTTSGGWRITGIAAQDP